MLFTRCARQAKLISDGMSDERTREIQRAALELQQFEGVCAEVGQPLLTQLSLPSTGPPSSTGQEIDTQDTEKRAGGSEHGASVQVAESLRKGGRPGRATEPGTGQGRLQRGRPVDAIRMEVSHP